MNVDFYGYSKGGGAGIAMMRTIAGLAGTDIKVRLFTAADFNFKNPHSFSARLVSYFRWQYFSRSRQRYQHGRPLVFEQFSAASLPYRTPVKSKDADAIHLHWVASMLDFRSFFDSIPDSIPIIWTLHDMSPFTGGCHYSWDCDKYTSFCYGCPQLNNHSNNRFAASVQKQKRRALHNKNIHVVANSHWIEAEARRSSVFSDAKSFRTIHFGLNTTVFLPMDKKRMRNVLGFSHDSFVLLFGADYLISPRKGGSVLVEALNILWAKGIAIEAVAFGRSVEYKALRPIKFVGMVETEHELARLYSAADVFVIPSIHEAFGLTAMEAMACGVPVVGFRTGGIPDLIRHGETGLLVDQVGDAKALSLAIARMIRDPVERRVMGDNARHLVEQNFSLQRQTDDYRDLYREITELG